MPKQPADTPFWQKWSTAAQHKKSDVPFCSSVLGGSNLKWVSKTHLLGLMVNHRLAWIPRPGNQGLCDQVRLTETIQVLTNKGFCNHRLYGLILWGACSNSDLFCSIEWLHRRTATIIFYLSKDMASSDVLLCDHCRVSSSIIAPKNRKIGNSGLRK